MPDSEFKILKLLNNNVLLAEDLSDGKEVILVGKGIAFGSKVNSVVGFADGQVEKVFFGINEKIKGEFYKLISQFDPQVIGLSEEVISVAESALGELNPHIHVTLTDHICFSLERFKAGIEIFNPFLQEIQLLYAAEYKVAEWAL